MSGLTCPVCQGAKPHNRVVCSRRCGDTALRLAAEVRAERDPAAAARLFVQVWPPAPAPAREPSSAALTATLEAVAARRRDQT